MTLGPEGKKSGRNLNIVKQNHFWYYFGFFFFSFGESFSYLAKHLVAPMSQVFPWKVSHLNEQNWVESFDNEPIYIFTDQVFLTLVLHDTVFAPALNEASEQKKAGNVPTNWAAHTRRSAALHRQSSNSQMVTLF